MVRKRPEERLQDFILAATEVFLEKGYRRAQMSDVTTRLNLSPGSIYRYFESKQALFDTVLRHAVDGVDPLDHSSIPISAPAREVTLAYLAEQVARRTALPVLENALTVRRPEDPQRELKGLALEVYHSLHRHRVALNLVERCALDWPQMAELWFGEGRSLVLGRIERYLVLRAEDGLFHPVPDPVAAARLFIEIASFLAVHRHDDPYPVEMSPDTAESLALHTIIRTYLKPEYIEPELQAGAASHSRR